MIYCVFCKADSQEFLSCVCGQVSYCDKECQTKDWTNHKSSCPPYTIREIPGMGRGLFATRKIKPGEIILEERPLLTLDLDEARDLRLVDGLPVGTIITSLKSQIQEMDEETKSKILDLYDPVENVKNLEADIADIADIDINLLIRFSSNLRCWKTFRGEDEVSKILRIFTCNNANICLHPEIYSKSADSGLYYKISLINHSCQPNSQYSWVRGDIKKKQVIAFKKIKKNHEILTFYSTISFGSIEERRNDLLELGMLCKCTECSLEGEALQENEKLRGEIRERREKIKTLTDVSKNSSKPNIEKAVKLSQELMKLVRKLDIPHSIFGQLLLTCLPVALCARRLGLTEGPSPETIKQEALMFGFGDDMLHSYKMITRDKEQEYA